MFLKALKKRLGERESRRGIKKKEFVTAAETVFVLSSRSSNTLCFFFSLERRSKGKRERDPLKKNKKGKTSLPALLCSLLETPFSDGPSVIRFLDALAGGRVGTTGPERKYTLPRAHQSTLVAKLASRGKQKLAPRFFFPSRSSHRPLASMRLLSFLGT